MTPDQIKAALEAGIISEDQAQDLRFKFKAENPYMAMIGDEDDMRFIRSFADVFISIGIGLLLFGLMGVATLFGGKTAYLGIAVIVWIMAEYFGRKKRAHLPTLICALAFLFFATAGLFALLEGAGIRSPIIGSFVTTLVMFAFYWRIRLPFCIILIAVSLLALFFSIITSISTGFTQDHFGWLTLFCGLIIFGIALWYDTQDTHRSTRFSDNAFWLHFIAAPLIIHGLILELISLNSEPLFNVFRVPVLDKADAWLMMFIVFCLALIALSINRRALLVSSLGYAGFAIAYLVKDTGMDLSWIITSTFVLLGGGIMFLGVGWHAVRNQLIKPLPNWPVFPPPYDPSYKAQIKAQRLARQAKD